MSKIKYRGFELGEHVYAKEEIKEDIIGECNCRICGETAKLIRRKGSLWECEVSECAGKISHSCIIKDKYHGIYKVGDYIRVYESTFENGSRLILNSFCDGVITKSYHDIGGYRFDYLVKREVINGEETPDTSWAIGRTITGRRHADRCVKLLKDVFGLIDYDSKYSGDAA